MSSDRGLACLPAFEDDGVVILTGEGWNVLTADVASGSRHLELRLVPAFGEEMVVSATGNATRLKDVPVHLETVGRDKILALQARTLAEAVEYTPGLRIESNCGNCNTTQLRMLGLEGPYSQIVVDGQPTVSSLALVYGLEQIPARMLDGIEVLKGSGSAIYGASSIAGTVNLIPHQADHGRIEIDIEGNTLRGTESETGGAVRGLFDWGTEDRRRSASLYGQRDDVPAADVNGDGFSEVTRRELTAFGARGQLVALADQAQLVGDVHWVDASRRGGDLTRIDRPPEETAVTEAIDTETLAGSLRWLHTIDATNDYRIALSRVDLDRDSYYGAGFDPRAYGRSTGNTTVLSAQFDRVVGRGTVSAGFQADRDDLFDEQLGYSRVTEEQSDNLGIYVQDDRRLGSKVTLLYGARYDDHSALADGIWSPRTALLFAPRSDLSVRLSYGLGFRPPITFDEDLHIELVGGGVARVLRNSPDLVEESSRSSLLSLEWRPDFGTRGNAALGVTAFDTRLDDLFFGREVDDPATPELEILRVNLGGAEVRGLEASATVRWGSSWQFEASFVTQRARYDEAEPDFGSRELWRTPEHYGSLSVRWAASSRIDVFAGAVYTGEMLAPHYAGFIDEDRLETTDSFLTFDANITTEVPLDDERSLRVTVGGRNLTDAFQDDLDRGPDRDSSYVVGPRYPRQLFVTLGLRL
ncbi:MAG: TonB-dependent receptor [Acidobacteriota bacterium]